MMMKLSMKLLKFFILIITLSSCSKDKAESPNPNSQNINPNQILIESIETADGGIMKFNYDIKNRLSKINNLNSKGDLQGYTIAEYKDDSNSVYCKSYDSLGNLSPEYYKYEMDLEGKIHKEINYVFYYSSWRETTKNYEYNSDKKIVKISGTTYYNGYTSPTGYFTLEYKNGNIALKKAYDVTGKYYELNQYEFDGKNNPFYGFNYFFLSKPEFICSPNNCTKITTDNISSNQTSIKETSYIYNEKNYPVTIMHKNYNGSISTIKINYK